MKFMNLISSVSEMNFWFVEPEKWSRKNIGLNSIRRKTGI